MTPEAFVADLDRTNREALDRLGAAATAGEPGPGLTVTLLLKLALKNEIEASEIAGLWMGRSPEIDVKLALARQAGDEAKHYRLIEERLAALDVPPGSVDPLAEGYTPLFQYLAGLETTVTPHSFRHGLATELVRRRVRESVVQRLLGHASPATTQIYVHLVDREILEEYDDAFGEYRPPT